MQQLLFWNKEKGLDYYFCSKQDFRESLTGLDAILVKIVSIFFHKSPILLTIHSPQNRRAYLYGYYSQSISQLKPGLALY